MAGEISYKIVAIEGQRIELEYTMGSVMVPLAFDWDGEADLEGLIATLAPRHLLKAKAALPHDSKLVGKTGFVDLDPTLLPVEVMTKQ